ncbi:acyl-CoA thioesterase [Nocardioides sp. SYSU DS0663]|uniref:acyl-CoA thioesterase n=1 Tax=Nocardioides sp. SYSU DS0663 TaxID=3416445 RepID=UPI003F4BB587
MPRNAAELVELLDLETIDTNLFRGARAESALPRVFGGQAAAQAVVAAGRTVDPSYLLHSLHSYFLQPGDTSAPIIYDVETVRDGRSFATRRVLGRQHGRPIYALTADFHRAEDGWEHERTAPVVPPPEEAIDPRAHLPRREGDDEFDVMDLRYVGSTLDGMLEPDATGTGRQRVWLRVSDRLPDDPFLHVAAFTYFSDMTLMGAALAPHGIRIGGREAMVASLDHTIWFHRPFRADEWWLYDQESPWAGAGRGLVHARVHITDGRLVASVAQEALLRKARDKA